MFRLLYNFRFDIVLSVKDGRQHLWSYLFCKKNRAQPTDLLFISSCSTCLTMFLLKFLRQGIKKISVFFYFTRYFWSQMNALNQNIFLTVSDVGGLSLSPSTQLVNQDSPPPIILTYCIVIGLCRTTSVAILPWQASKQSYTEVFRSKPHKFSGPYSQCTLHRTATFVNVTENVSTLTCFSSSWHSKRNLLKSHYFLLQ